MINLQQIQEVQQAISHSPVLPWFYGYLGWLIYNLYLLNKAEAQFDVDQDGYSVEEVKRYLKKKSIAIILSFLLVIVGVVGMPLLWVWLAPDGMEFHISAYFLAGGMAVLLQWVLEKRLKS